jgi:hypothetical protein
MGAVRALTKTLPVPKLSKVPKGAARAERVGAFGSIGTFGSGSICSAAPRKASQGRLTTTHPMRPHAPDAPPRPQLQNLRAVA